MQKKTIAIFTAPQGHLSIADAISQKIKDEDNEIVTFFDKNEFFSLYSAVFYQMFPGLFKIPFKFFEQEVFIKQFTSYYYSRYQESLYSFVKTHSPNLLINTYFMYSPVLEEIAEKLNIPFINIVTDPRTFHKLILSSPSAINLCFDEKACDLVQKLIPGCKASQSGWFVRQEYEQEYKKEEVRKNLKLEKNTLTFLIASGSDGTNMIVKILPLLFNSRKSLQVIVACGNNKTLYNLVTSVSKLVKKNSGKVRIIPLKFTKELHLYMQAADLIIGKAGPNTLFESVATLTPFFAITHIAGQEDGNLELIREYNLGYVEENPVKAIKLLRRIINKPQQLETFAPYLQELAIYNQKSKEILLKVLK